MNPDARSLGRLLCVGVRGAEIGDPRLEADLSRCAEAGVGGVILFDVDVPTARRLEAEGVPRDQARARATRNILGAEALRELIAHLRRRLGEDLLVAIDQEGGAVARLSAARGFDPGVSARTFASLTDEERQRVAARQARQLAVLDIDLNFAPCVDLALEPSSSIIAQVGRSYGAAEAEVIACAKHVLEAHIAAGVGTCLKHFPGHGSASGDTHLGLVDIARTWQPDRELEPYRALAGRQGVAVMMSHVVHAGLDPEHPLSMSAEAIGGMLRTELGFDGVVATDSIDMRAVLGRFSREDAAVRSVAAGVDLVVDAVNLGDVDEHPAPDLVRALREAVERDRVPGGWDRIAKSQHRLNEIRALRKTRKKN